MPSFDGITLNAALQNITVMREPSLMRTSAGLIGGESKLSGIGCIEDEGGPYGRAQGMADDSSSSNLAASRQILTLLSNAFDSPTL